MPARSFPFLPLSSLSRLRNVYDRLCLLRRSSSTEDILDNHSLSTITFACTRLNPYSFLLFKATSELGPLTLAVRYVALVELHALLHLLVLLIASRIFRYLIVSLRLVWLAISARWVHHLFFGVG